MVCPERCRVVVSRRAWRALACCAALLAGVSVRPGRAAAEELGDPLRLDDVVAYARAHNPETRAAAERARAMAAVPDRVSAYDDPTLSWEAWNFPDNWRIDQADNNIFRIAQKIPFPGKRTTAGEVAAHEAQMAGEEARSTGLDVVSDVKKAYADLWQADESLTIYARDKDLVQRFAHIAEQKYAVGEVSQSDVLRAQVELTHETNRLKTAQLAVELARAELNGLLSRSPGDPLGKPEDPPMAVPRFDLDELTQRALAERPEVAAMQAAIARQKSNVDLAHMNFRPDFEVSIGRFVNYGASDGFGAMASVTLPFAYLSKYDAGVQEANAGLASAQSELRRVQDRVRRQVAQALLRVQTASLQHDLAVSTHIPQAEQAVRVTESAYQSGSVDFLGLIDTVRRIEMVHLDHIQASTDFAKAYADLERAVGGDLPSGAAEK